MPLDSKPPRWNYIATAAALIIATGVRWLLDPALGEQRPFVTYSVAVLLIAWRSGPGPSLVALILGWWLGEFFFGTSRHALYPQNFDVPHLVDVITYFVVGAISMVIVRVARTTRSSHDHAKIESERLAAIVTSSDDAIISKDLTGRITSWNTGAQRLFGYTAQEMIGQPVTKLIPPERFNEEPDILSRIKRGEMVDHYETVRRRKDGTLINISLTVSPLRNSQGTVVGASKIVRDITVSKKTEQALRESEQQARKLLTEAENASRSKDEFLAMLSHELRTPMAAILGWAKMLRGGMSPEETRQGIDVIERNARLQSRIIDDLLDMSRIVSGKFRLDIQTVNVNQILAAAVESVRFAANAKEVQLSLITDPNVGDIRGDANRLQQVFFNLLTNATKFTLKGDRIQVICRRLPAHVEISISDSGIGINPEFIPHVFERFKQQDSKTTRQYQGLGLGLAIVKHLVELHGGTVHAASEGEGKGATFTVRLPISIALVPTSVPGWGEQRDLLQEAWIKRNNSITVDATALAGVTVMVTDDEPDAREVVKKMLELRGAKVLVCGSAVDTMDRLQRHHPDVLVCDIGMPGMDGYGLIARIRSTPPDRGGATPAIALTAFARSEDRSRSLLAGFQMHLAKPVEPEELIAGIRSVTSGG